MRENGNLKTAMILKKKERRATVGETRVGAGEQTSQLISRSIIILIIVTVRNDADHSGPAV
jgi:hypothetical protein